MNKPLCFVIMPFGKKKDQEGNEINFDNVYNSFIKPSIEAADMDPIRADEETVNGIIHKPMYERLILCDYAIADLTTANANVFYELGIRHAVKPHTTISIFASNSKLPFDVNFLRCMPYDYDNVKGFTNIEKNVAGLTKQLTNAKKDKTTDSPVYQLVDGIQFQNSVAHEKTDVFRERVKYTNEIKDKLAAARDAKGSKAEKIAAIEEIVASLGSLENQETAVLIDCMLSYRAIGVMDKMISFIESMPVHVQHTVMVQEQLGFALNRSKQREKAKSVLEAVIKKNGPSSETYGILGRVYKDLFVESLEAGNERESNGLLRKATEIYIKGFEADWRDSYPGINALTLLELQGKTPDINKLAPVVEFAVRRKMERKEPDYWDYATLLEMAIIENDEAKAIDNLEQALSCSYEKEWMPDTTINNLNLISKFRKKRNGDEKLVEQIISDLESAKK